MRLLTRRRELPVLPVEVARHAAMVDADANGILPAQARTRTAIKSAAAAWVGLAGATRFVETFRIQVPNREGTLVDVHIAITVGRAR